MSVSNPIFWIITIGLVILVAYLSRKMITGKPGRGTSEVDFDDDKNN
tara:strand:- start:465 stop:605 length:141 start_codon:yes stop_codon:yes gene_type:complete